MKSPRFLRLCFHMTEKSKNCEVWPRKVRGPSGYVTFLCLTNLQQGASVTFFACFPTIYPPCFTGHWLHAQCCPGHRRGSSQRDTGTFTSMREAGKKKWPELQQGVSTTDVWALAWRTGHAPLSTTPSHSVNAHNFSLCLKWGTFRKPGETLVHVKLK